LKNETNIMIDIFYPAAFNQVDISNKCFIHCPAEDKAKTTIFGFELQDEQKLEIISAG